MSCMSLSINTTISTLALLIAKLPAQAAGRNPNLRILPINSTPFGKTYGEWSAEHWKWTFSFPVEQ